MFFSLFFFQKKKAPSPLDRLCPFKSLAVMTPSPSRSKVLKALLQHSFERPGVVGSVDVASGWTPVGLWAQVDIDMTWLGRNWDGWGGRWWWLVSGGKKKSRDSCPRAHSTTDSTFGKKSGTVQSSLFISQMFSGFEKTLNINKQKHAFFLDKITTKTSFF